MVQSLWNRKSKLPDFELCIIDECHVAIFDKMIPYLKEARIIGFTATPVRLGRYKINDNQTAQKRFQMFMMTLYVVNQFLG